MRKSEGYALLFEKFTRWRNFSEKESYITLDSNIIFFYSDHGRTLDACIEFEDKSDIIGAYIYNNDRLYKSQMISEIIKILPYNSIQ